MHRVQSMQRMPAGDGPRGLTRASQEKDKITLRSDTGEMRNLDVVAFDLPRGNIAAYYPEANVLVGQTVDQRSRTPAFKSVPVSVEAQVVIGSTG